jgi:uncharacterized damage-inducible protein DinB
MKRTVSMMAAMAFVCAGAFAQDNPFSGGTKKLYGMIKGNLVKAAEKMPEENYNFKPTPEVRSWAELVGHVADSQIMFCAAVKGEKPKTVAGKKTAKADLVAAMKEAVAYCDPVYSAMTDAEAAKTIKFFGGNWTKLSVLDFNVAHDNEHYGNMVTYMRLKGIVPPSSEGGSN